MTPPSSLPSNITCDLNVVSFDCSIPLALDILLDGACKIILTEEGNHFRDLCEETAKIRTELRDLDIKLFQSLPKKGKADNYWNSTEKIREIMSKKENVCTN